MRQGDVVDGRFTIERLAGSGGMGQVYLARDQRGDPVAVKVLRVVTESARFLREAQVLAAIAHPGILRYIAHGVSEAGPYLVTEWLQGETLSARVERGKLSVSEAIELGTRVLRTLAAVHRLGVVHRDLKPSNLFLVGGAISGVTVLDFGIARIADLGHDLTATGAVIGTVGYMAPEQARGRKEIDARADLFSLGCVLYRCLTREAPFPGTDPLAVLLKAAFEEPIPLRDLRPDVPASVSRVVAQLMAKRPDDRPADAEVAAIALAAARADVGRAGLPPGAEEAPVSARPKLTQVEQRVMSLVLAGSPERAFAERTTASEGTFPSDPSFDPAADGHAQARVLSAAAERAGGQAEVLADGSRLITLVSSGAASDLAARAARAALAVRPFVEGAPIAVVSGRGVLSPRLPLGELFDRATALLRLDAGDAVRIDQATAGLIGAGFEVEEAGAACLLRGERDQPASAVRTLLGRPAAFVGRERELGMLEALLIECVSEPGARAVLVTGEPGMGKSRLAAELVRRLPQLAPAAEVWTARGDAMSEGSAYALLGALIRGAAGLVAGTPAEARYEALRARVGRHLPADDIGLVTELLGELAGVPVPEAEASAALHLTRQDPLALGEQMRRAAEAFLTAECGAHPVVLLLEDLHWADPPSIAFVDAALRAQRDRPLFVLALARPEVLVAFPRLWAHREVHQMPLRKLTAKAAERFARQALGDEVVASRVRRVVERADGNAFFLEELIRAVAEGRDQREAPETVLAMVQSRLEGMEPEARWVLRAAGVFGTTFWRGGVAALVGERRAAEWLAQLAEREVISPPREGRFADEPEHDFRHAIVQEAAYAMLTERDRETAHRVAGAWLEASGEDDAMILAEHAARGGDPRRAAAFCRRGAEQALRASDLDAAVADAERGLEAGPEGELRAALVATLLEAHAWRNDWAAGARYADEVFAREPKGSRSWAMAALVKVWAAPLLGHLDGMMEAMGPLAVVDPHEGAASELVQALAAVVMALTVVSQHEAAASYLARMAQVAAAERAPSPVVRGWLAVARGYALRQREGDLAGSFAQMSAARAAFAEAGNPHQVAWAEMHMGLDLWLLGDQGAAIRAIRAGSREPGQSVRPSARPEELRPEAPSTLTHLPVVASLGKFVVANALLELGHEELARGEALAMVEAESAQKNRFFEGLGRSTLSEAHRAARDLPAAEREALAAIELLEAVPYDRAIALSRLATVRRDQGRAEEALACAEEAVSLLAAAPGYAEPRVRLALAEALWACGRRGEARASLAETRRRMMARAETLSEAQRATYLAKVPAHARVVELAEEWGSG